MNVKLIEIKGFKVKYIHILNIIKEKHTKEQINKQACCGRLNC